MIVAHHERSGSWLPWTTLILLGVVVLGLLGSGPHPTQALAPVAGIEVEKSVNVLSVLPGQTPYPLYTVTFRNNTTSDLVLGSIVDTLPPGFLFGWVNTTLSDWDSPPSDGDAPEIVWTADDMTVPAGGQRSLVYTVRVPSTVPKDVVPYENRVVAWAQDGSLVGEATASLIVGQTELALDKVASAEEVANGQPVTFTITLANNGEVTATVDLLTDVMDPALAFAGVVPGGDLGAPVESPAGTLVWEGPITVLPRSALTQSYTVDTPEGTDRFQACNHVEISSPDGLPPAVEACVRVQPERVYLYLPAVYEDFQFAWLAVEKSVAPQAIVAGSQSEVVYSVSIANGGDTTGTLLTIKDTLPAGMTFLGMEPGSDVTANPSGTTGTIVWSGDWSMPPGERLDVLYRVRANLSEGSYANSVVVTAREALVPEEPAEAILHSEVPIAGLSASNDGPTPKGRPTTLSASVTAGSNVVYTWDLGDGTTGTGSSVSHVYPDLGTYVATVTAKNGVSQATAITTVSIKPAVLLEERFDDASVGISRWTKFMNYWRLEEGQWYWGRTDGVGGSGAATQDCYLGGKKMAEDALLMYLDPEAENWTDYRVETDLLLRGGADELEDGTIIWIEEGGHPIGLWVRGHYKDVGREDTGGWVTGYYIVAGGNPNNKAMYIRLAQLQTLTDCWGTACSNPGNLYDFNNPHVIMEVRLERTFARRTWYNLAVEVRGNNIKVFFEGEQVIEWNDPKEPFLTGTIGFKTYKSETASFDNVIVTPLD
jgi:uncharacterized repeat protein (TIGR01451 family)